MHHEFGLSVSEFEGGLRILPRNIQVFRQGVEKRQGHGFDGARGDIGFACRAFISTATEPSHHAQQYPRRAASSNGHGGLVLWQKAHGKVRFQLKLVRGNRRVGSTGMGLPPARRLRRVRCLLRQNPRHATTR